MTTSNNTLSQIAKVVEYARLNGIVHGAKLSVIRPAQGTLVAAIQRIEIISSQMVSLWIQGGRANDELWEIAHDVFAPTLSALLLITRGEWANGCPNTPSARLQLGAVVDAIHEAVDNFCAPRSNLDFRQAATALLVMAMVARQLIEAEFATGGDVRRFAFYSRDVAESFFMQAIDALKYCPFGLQRGCSLEDVVKAIEINTVLGREEL